MNAFVKKIVDEIGRWAIDTFAFKGEAGVPGPQGPQGEKGDKGDPGDSVTYFPAVTIFGQPHIEGTQVNGFSANDYLQFPFVVNFAGRPWTLHFDIATGADVSKQHNIFDSQFGLAFAFANGHFVMAMSSNGTSWDLGANEGTYAILPNQTYHIRMSWDGQTYRLEWSIDEVQWMTDIEVASTASLYPRQIVIGKDIFTGEHYYNGTINFAHAQLAIAGLIVWEGMTEVGTATRMALDMSNIDEEGIAKMEQIVGSFYVKGSMIRGDINLAGSSISGSSIYGDSIQVGSNTTITGGGIIVGSGSGSITAGIILGSYISGDGISGSYINATTISVGSSTAISGGGMIVCSGSGFIWAGSISGSSIQVGSNTTISGGGIIVGGGSGSITAGIIFGSYISGDGISGSYINATTISVGSSTAISGGGMIVGSGSGFIWAGYISGSSIQVGSDTTITGGGIYGPGYFYGSYYLSGNGYSLSGGALILGSVILSGGDIEKLHNL